jgi:IstB-like ATP binding protein
VSRWFLLQRTPAVDTLTNVVPGVDFARGNAGTWCHCGTTGGPHGAVRRHYCCDAGTRPVTVVPLPGRDRTCRFPGRLDEELELLRRIPLVVVDEVGYIPFDPEAAALFFALVSSRYERASLIVSSNKTFSAWAEIFGDPVAVAAMVDRLVHHAEVIVLKGESYRLKGRGKEVIAGQEASGV